MRGRRAIRVEPWRSERPELKEGVLVRQAKGVGTYDESVIADDEEALNVNAGAG